MVAFGVDVSGTARTKGDTGCVRVVVARVQDLREVRLVLKSDGFDHAAICCSGRKPFTAGDIFRAPPVTEAQLIVCNEAEVLCDDGQTFETFAYKPELIRAIAAMPVPLSACTGAVVAYIPGFLCNTRKYTVVLNFTRV